MRIASIDILRALTMVLMIWVNDFWTLTKVPKWLEHAKPSEDYLGFSDIIFPLFLFIVGLSIPFAIDNRLKKNETKLTIGKHIFIRTLSLILIGFYMVNYETANHELIVIGKHFWLLLMALAVFLIWMQWKKSPINSKWHIPLQCIGFIILFYLAYIYKGGVNGEQWMTKQWWGILGLIGWAYFINAIIYLFSKAKYRLNISIITWATFLFLAIANQNEQLSTNNNIIRIFSTIYSGTIPAFTASGVLTTLLFKKYSNANLKKLYFIIILLGILCISYGLITRPTWGISKIQGTPSWLTICIGIGFLSFIIFHFIADIKKKTNWSKLIIPAGTATLTCYMIPYIIYPIRNITEIRLPEILNTSYIGLISSIIFSFLVVIFTRYLEKKGFKLKL